MKVLSVVGARPQFVKLAPIAAATRQLDVDHIVVHTGQHYDESMSQSFFDTLAIPDPDVNLGVGSGSHGTQTGRILGELEPVLQHHQPDWVLVYGDTNSTLAAAICAVKIHLPVAHLEAGLRSFNRQMPEEHNRVLTDHCSDLLLAPTRAAAAQLSREGLAGRTVVVGDVMADICLAVRDEVSARPTAVPLPIPSGSPYFLATVHRAENTDDPERLGAILDALRKLPIDTVLLAHPRLVARAQSFGLSLAGGALHPAPPLTYPHLVKALAQSRGVVTDSGGLQKEAYLLGKICTTLRTETEWAETLEGSWNVLAPEPSDVRRLATRPEPDAAPLPVYGNGDAALRTIQQLVTHA